MIFPHAPVPAPQTNGHVKDENEMKMMLGQTSLPSFPSQEGGAAAPPLAKEAEQRQPTPTQQQAHPHHQQQQQRLEAKQPPQPLPPAEPSFNFLQESQIDLESPMMDPAVVMVHGGRKPDQSGYPAPMFPNPPSLNLENLSQQFLQQHAAAIAHHHQQQMQQQQQNSQQELHQQQQQQTNQQHHEKQQQQLLHQQQIITRGAPSYPANAVKLQELESSLQQQEQLQRSSIQE